MTRPGKNNDDRDSDDEYDKRVPPRPQTESAGTGPGSKSRTAVGTNDGSEGSGGGNRFIPRKGGGAGGEGFGGWGGGFGGGASGGGSGSGSGGQWGDQPGDWYDFRSEPIKHEQLKDLAIDALSQCKLKDLQQTYARLLLKTSEYGMETEAVADVLARLVVTAYTVARHLPPDNKLEEMRFYFGCFSQSQLHRIIELAANESQHWT